MDAQILLDNFDHIIEAFKARDEHHKKTSDAFTELIKELQEIVIEQKGQIKDLQDTVSDMVLLTGPTDSNN